MILKRMSIALAIAGFFLASAAALSYAQGTESVSAETARRTMQVLSGIILAAYANTMPKDLGPWPRSVRAAARVQSALRIGGWSLTGAGLAYAGLWAFAPLAFADLASMVIVAGATTVTAFYGAWAFASCRRRNGDTVDGMGV